MSPESRRLVIDGRLKCGAAASFVLCSAAFARLSRRVDSRGDLCVGIVSVNAGVMLPLHSSIRPLRAVGLRPPGRKRAVTAPEDDRSCGYRRES
ncbi:hypothetical protein EYF80_060115 [Liparis tanakae]|uniref:Uncharacterized protein n=1 Tax=Liparis tanakae TaxID=230148 RepID=A0A4Z2ELT8_9TELE|nr:hypothetical protein EYF80_060115 [Liparis tanakae]